MASHQRLLQHTKEQCLSPANVFAKLKSKVQNMTVCANAVSFTSYSEHGAEFNSPRKKQRRVSESDEPRHNLNVGTYRSEAQPLTLSPTSSPQKPFGQSYPGFSSKPVNETPPVADDGHGFKGRDGEFLENLSIRDDPQITRGMDEFTVTSKSSPAFSKLKKRVSRRTEEDTGCPPEESPICSEDPVIHSSPLKNTCIPSRSIADERCHIILKQLPLMSPAKMFAHMKERESKRQLFDTDNFHNPTDTPFSAADSLCVNEEFAPRNTQGSEAPTNQREVDPADSQLDTDSSESTLTPAVSSHLILLEDPLVLKSPQVSIPKKPQPVLKRNNWPNQTNFPSESMIYLEKWFLRKDTNGMFVEGLHKRENIMWNSTYIKDRISNSVVKTVTGRVYILVGKINFKLSSDFPRWFLNKFTHGFPPNWKALYEKLLSESSKRTERNTEGNKAKSDSSTVHPVKQKRQKSPRISESCSPACSSVKVSRSGRVIKPPLEYWKGGRVILDAFMNVTIHECYNSSICDPDIKSPASTRVSQEPVRVCLPHSKGQKQRESPSDKESPVRLRKARAPVGRCTRAKAKPGKKTSDSIEPTVELVSPEAESGRILRSSRRTPATDKDTDNKDCSEGETRGREVHGKKERTVQKKSQRNLRSSNWSSTESFEECRKELKNKTKNGEAQTYQKCRGCKPSKTSPPSKPLPKTTQSTKRHNQANNDKQEDDNKWTEAELLKLQEAVSAYPKYTKGFWTKVGRIVGTRSGEECYNQHILQGRPCSPIKNPSKPRKKKVKVPKVPDNPLISARVGTLKRKQEVRHFLETMPQENMDDAFSSAYMQNKRFEMPSLCPSDDHDIAMSDLEPLTPRSTCFPEVKTPQCLAITPGMMGSPNRINDDKYIYKLQKKMKKNQFDVCKLSAPTKSFTPTPSVKRSMRRCGNTENDNFVVWEMFPGNNGALSESEEEDFYFSDEN
ncbi:mis18-binding protein 1 isoform 2-T2 [Pholidichthys leucotaenia]